MYSPRPPRDTQVNEWMAATTQTVTQYTAESIQRQETPSRGLQPFAGQDSYTMAGKPPDVPDTLAEPRRMKEPPLAGAETRTRRGQGDRHARHSA